MAQFVWDKTDKKLIPKEEMMAQEHQSPAPVSPSMDNEEQPSTRPRNKRND